MARVWYFYPDSFSYPQGRKLRSVHYSHNARGYCLPWLAGLGGEAGCSDQQFVSTPIIILHQESVRASKWKNKAFITALTHLSLLLIRVLHFLLFFGIFSYLHGLIKTCNVIYFWEKFPPTLFFT